MELVWATRGRDWGFRFLLDGGFANPYSMYESVFSGLEGESEVCRRIGARVALRFPDPLARRDSAGRVIPHDFVVLPPLADDVHSVEEGIFVIWPLVADAYADVWDRLRPPSEPSVRSALALALDPSTASEEESATDHDSPDGLPRRILASEKPAWLGLGLALAATSFAAISVWVWRRATHGIVTARRRSPDVSRGETGNETRLGTGTKVRNARSGTAC